MNYIGKLLRGAPGAGLVLGISLLALAGCTHYYQLVPAPTATWTAGPGRAAIGEAEGVRMTVRAGLWNGDPPRLHQHVLPLRVEIENRSGRPLRVLYSDFRIESDEGVTLRTIPPLKVKGSAVIAQGYVQPDFTYSGFYFAPHYRPYYGGGPFWGDAWPYDDAYAGYYTTWRQPLPTVDMLRRAMPEGVVQEGGRLNGFLYLQRLKEDVPRVTFVATLVDARTGQAFGRIEIPFAVVK